jgi:hypothetical protein
MADEDLGSRVEQLNRKLRAGELGWEPGHFYSPLPDLVDIHRRRAGIFTPRPDVPGIDLNLPGQLDLLRQLAGEYAGLPWSEKKQPRLRYHFDNPNFSYGESIVLYCLIKRLRPRRIVEIGSGHSSGVILDTNQLAFQGGIECSFVEPYPELLRSLMEPGDQGAVKVFDQGVQDVGLDPFTRLAAGDILFVDSSHVSKIGSDVNFIVFEILPALAPGVYVHFHDIMVGFEYPEAWIYQGRAWNEAYLMRAFLQYNRSFSIELFNSYLGHFHRAALIAALPLADRNPGTSLWLRKQAHGTG